MKHWFPYILSAVLIMVMLSDACSGAGTSEKIPVEKDIYVPSLVVIHDTIEKPVPIASTEDLVYYHRYKSLKDSIKKDSAYRMDTSIREYREYFKDTFQTLEVYTKTRGEMLSQTIKYTTNPYTITVRDTIEVRRKGYLSGITAFGLPLGDQIGNPIAKVGLMYTNKNQHSLSISYDTQRRLWVGGSLKLF